jgi:Tfp pilus assembly protein FimV
MFESALDTERAFEHHRAVERTYVRRRRTAAVLGTALIVVLLSPLAAGAVRRGEASDGPAQRAVVVREGDTLWSIALQVQPDQDARATIDAIQQLNQVDAGGLVPGQTLVVPVG